MRFGKAIFEDIEILNILEKNGGTKQSPTMFWQCIISLNKIKYTINDYQKNSLFQRLHLGKKYIFECDIVPNKRFGSIYLALSKVYYRSGSSRYEVKKTD